MAVTRRTLLKTIVAAGAGAVVGSSGYGYLYERHALALTRSDVLVGGLPEALSGLRVGLLTDIHRSRWVLDEDVDAAVRLLMQARPDLIVLGGDFVTWGDRRFVGAAAESLGGLAAPHGVFAILGNHDDDHDMPAALIARGISVLRDARTRLTIRNAAIELAGIRFWTRRQADIAAVTRGATAPVILLAHDPRRLTEAAALGIPLVLSGHTHGGQVVLPGLGAVAAQKFPVVSGFAREAGTSLFVSRGVGTVYVPVRVNCPPEVALLTLRPGHTAPAHRG
ncbi:MAG TPA: metallophosphoesterase [Vicinamibacterales bacterium]|nr:metallophosphoesterase [Vicinamibacterales bacterium]